MLETETIYLKARVKGLFKCLFPRNTGDYEIKKIQPSSVSIYDAVVVPPFNLDELKIGRFYEPVKPIENVRVYISEKQYISQTISTILFQQMNMGEEVTMNGESYTKFEAICYFKAPKLIPIVKTPSLENKFFQKIPRVLFSTIGLGSNYDKWRYGEGNAGINDALPTEKKKNVFVDILKMVVFGLIIALILWKTSFFRVGIFLVLFLVLILVIQRIGGFFTAFRVGEFFLNLIAWLFLFAGIFGLISGHYSWTNLLLFAIGISLMFASRFGKILKMIGWILLIGAIIGFYQLHKMHKLNPKEDDTSFVENDKNDWDYKPKVEEAKVVTDGNDTLHVKYLSHILTWVANFKKGFQTHLKVREDYYHLAKLDHENLNIPETDFREYYNRIYVKLIEQNQGKLDNVIDAYAVKGKKNNLTRTQFADMVVTSIQSIPYCMVHDFSHAKAEQVYGASISNYHQTGGPCLAEVKFGLQAPSEFIANFKGDCDTRSLLLYYILSKFGYDCVVLGSTQYSHAILGISGPYNGDNVLYKRTKYYGWETTAKYFTPGNLSPECNNMRYWEVVLGKMN